MKKSSLQKSAKETHKKHQHSTASSHSHAHKKNGEKIHPLAAFFSCCLNDESGQISPKIQQLREKLPNSSTEEVKITPDMAIIITKDMIIGDIIANFPLTRSIFEDIHPLGLLSPQLDQISIEMFLSDLNTDPDQICVGLTSLINS